MLRRPDATRIRLESGQRCIVRFCKQDQCTELDSQVLTVPVNMFSSEIWGSVLIGGFTPDKMLLLSGDNVLLGGRGTDHQGLNP